MLFAGGFYIVYSLDLRGEGAASVKNMKPFDENVF